VAQSYFCVCCEFLHRRPILIFLDDLLSCSAHFSRSPFELVVFSNSFRECFPYWSSLRCGMRHGSQCLSSKFFSSLKTISNDTNVSCVKVIRVIPYSAVQLFAYEAYKVIFCIDYLGYLEVVFLSPFSPIAISFAIDTCYVH